MDTPLHDVSKQYFYKNLCVQTSNNFVMFSGLDQVLDYIQRNGSSKKNHKVMRVDLIFFHEKLNSKRCNAY